MITKNKSSMGPAMILTVLIMLLAMFGCAAMDEIKRDHLRAGEWHEDTMPDAMERLKRDYMGAEWTIQDKFREKRLKEIASDEFLRSNEAPYYADEPYLVRDPGMPAAFHYRFIHFPVLKTSPEEFQGSTFLVVIHRLNDQVVHSGVFRMPDGDPFYRYSSVLQNIL